MVEQRDTQETENARLGESSSGDPEATTEGVIYEPRVSERRYLDFLDRLSAEEQQDVTKEEVIAYMGEPTHRDPPVSGTKDGFAFTLEVLHWKRPGSGVESTVSIVNGRTAGQVIGMETGARSR